MNRVADEDNFSMFSAMPWERESAPTKLEIKKLGLANKLFEKAKKIFGLKGRTSAAIASMRTC